MDRDFVYRQTLVWLECEEILRCTGKVAPICQNCRDRQARLAESLTNHLVNNWEQIQRAKGGSGFTMQELTDMATKKLNAITHRDTPEYYDKGE